jgi:glyoxylase-like metal-dependent hydrolase (beta-lactamase superfamily II)
MGTSTNSIALLSDGHFKLDGGVLFGQVPKVLWERFAPVDRLNRVRLGLNCLLIRTDQHNILVDTGVGTKSTEKVKEAYGIGSGKLLRSLKGIGLSARDIHIVVLTHLHFDHAGGCTKLDRSGFPIPTFPSASYYVQREAWEEAINPDERSKGSYIPDDFMPLEKQGHLHFLEGDTEIAPSVWVKMTGGHSRGHQMVYAHHGGERVAFLGDLVPTPHHLKLPYITALDRSPADTLESKRGILGQAEKEGWLLLFPHGNTDRAGYLERRDGVLNFRAVEL